MTGKLQSTTLKYRLNKADSNANGADTVTIVYTVPADAWCGVAVSTTGGMIGSEAVVGSPATGEVKKYSLTSYGGITEMGADKQTLINTSILSGAGESGVSTTTITYTKILAEAGEIEIKAVGENIFLGAWGSSTTLGYHGAQQRDKFTLAFSQVPTAAPTTFAPAVAPTSPADFKTLALTQKLEGSSLSYRFNFDDVDTITVIMTAPTAGWLGTGPSLTGAMLGSEVVVGLPGTGEVKKYSLDAKTVAGVVQMPADKQTLIDASVTTANGVSTLTYTKILKEEGELAIDPNGENIFVAAHGTGSNSLTFHTAYGSFKLSGETIKRDDTYWVAHGWIAALAWGAICPLAIMAGVFRSFFPDGPHWFNIHRGLNTLVVVMTIAALALATVAINEETPEGVENSHYKKDVSGGHGLIGLIITVLAVIQAIGGIMRPHLPKDADPEAGQAAEEKSGARKAFEIGHRLFGIALLSLCWYQVQLGIKTFHNIFNKGDLDTLLTAFWGVAGSLGGIILVGFVLRFKKNPA